MTTPLPPLPEPERPNESGETPCLVRYMLETEHGWIGSWGSCAIPELAKAERKAALLWAAELCEKMDGSSCGLGFRTQYDCAVRLRAEAEKIK